MATLLSFLLVTGLGARAAGAGPDGAQPADHGAKARARTLYEKGVEAYARGRYHEAADYFLDTHRIYPTAELSFNIGKAYDEVGNVPGALRYYRDYLRGSPDAPDREEVSARIRALEQALGERGLQQLTVLSSPEGATVLLDGRPVGVTPWTYEIWPGRHRLNLVLEGHLSSDDVVAVDLHRATETAIVLTPAPTVAREIPRREPRPESGARSIGALTWVALGLGTVALGTALTLEMADHEASGLSRASAFLAGTGVASSVLGGVMLYIDMNSLVPGARRTGSVAR